MSQDSFTEVTNESWVSRLGGAIKGVLIGGALFVFAFPFLFWNEGRAVKTYKSLKEGAAAVVSVPADAAKPANAGKLVHMIGKADTEETLKDSVFGVSAQAIRLKRIVQMYQWQEESDSSRKKKLGGGTETTTTYTYTKVWAPTWIDSSKFKQPDAHQNPAEMPQQTSEWTAKTVRVGAFELTLSLVSQIDQYTPLSANANSREATSLPAQFRWDDGGFYRGRTPSSPQVGDVRISFQKVEPAEVSIVARQNGTSLEPYATKVGGVIAMLRAGRYPADAMFQAAQQANARMTWIFRLGGFLAMFIGLIMVLRPLSVMADVLPILGSIVAVGTGTIAFLSSAVLALLTVAVAWIVYRPVLGIAILVAAGALGFLLKSRLGRQKAAPALAEEPTLRRAA